METEDKKGRGRPAKTQGERLTQSHIALSKNDTERVAALAAKNGLPFAVQTRMLLLIALDRVERESRNAE